MLKNTDRHAHETERALKVGDFARFPIDQLGDEKVYPHRFEVVSFGPDGTTTVRRLHDGFTRSVRASWVAHYLLDEDRRQAPAEDNLALRERAKREARAIDPDRPETPGMSFYVTVRDANRSAFLLGPYATHREASKNVQRARQKARDVDSKSCWYAFGTTSAPVESPIETLFGK